VHKRVFRLPQETCRRKRLLVLLDEKREFTAALQSEQFRVIAFLSSLMIICSERTIFKADRETKMTFTEKDRNPLHYFYDKLTFSRVEIQRTAHEIFYIDCRTT